MKIAADFKDKAILLSWALGFIILISLIWILTQPVQSYYLLRTVNNMFISNNDPRRLTSHVSMGTGQMGYWYDMHNSQDKMFVFTVFQDGILVPLGAVVSAEGKVNEVIPLSAHARDVFEYMPESILNMYIRRIEGAVKNE